MPSRRKLVTGETADILYTSKSPEVLYQDKEMEETSPKSRGKRNIHPHHPAEGREMDTLCGYQGTISNEPIDEYLVYRLLYPGYELGDERGFTRET